MKKNIILLILLFTNYIKVFSQETIKMTMDGGVYSIPCSVNGLSLKFIFDTGASDVSISLSEALFMKKNGYLSEYDIKGSTYYQIANGQIVKGTTINLKELKIGNRILYNVKASIVHSLSSPLLLGQSALSKLGKFSFDYSNNTLIFDNINSSIIKTQNQSYTGNNDNNIYFTTMKSEGKLRSIDTPISDIIKYIPNNATVRIIENKGDYWKIFHEGNTGYLNEMYLNVTYDMTTLKKVNKINPTKSSPISNLNHEITTMKSEGKLRIGDSPISDVIKYIPNGETVRVIENKGDYWKVFYDGKTGYLNGMYLNITYNMTLMKR